MQIGCWMETDSIAACRQNINILGTKTVNNVPGVFRDVKKFCDNRSFVRNHAGFAPRRRSGSRRPQAGGKEEEEKKHDPRALHMAEGEETEAHHCEGDGRAAAPSEGDQDEAGIEKQARMIHEP